MTEEVQVIVTEHVIWALLCPQSVLSKCCVCWFPLFYLRQQTRFNNIMLMINGTLNLCLKCQNNFIFFLSNATMFHLLFSFWSADHPTLGAHVGESPWMCKVNTKRYQIMINPSLPQLTDLRKLCRDLNETLPVALAPPNEGNWCIVAMRLGLDSVSLSAPNLYILIKSYDQVIAQWLNACRKSSVQFLQSPSVENFLKTWKADLVLVVDSTEQGRSMII